jgi:2-polyprenyl-3-methyl-5-hydroxy-6-metoxy-1,4-benzoquinol methylase
MLWVAPEDRTVLALCQLGDSAAACRFIEMTDSHNTEHKNRRRIFRDMQHTTISFSFGKNWQDFVKSYLTPERVTIAKQHLTEFLEIPNLQGRTFVDIGCGSGLSSLAAYELGAAKITSFDVDPDAVRTSQQLKAMVANPAHWTIVQGSILDDQFIGTLEQAEIVYSWGVLHHTGRMWDAIEHAARLLADNGLLYIALYTTTPRSPYWIRMKKRYNQASVFGKRVMEIGFIGGQLCKTLFVRFQNPIRYVLDYKKRRGMAYLTDVRDWLGGYPYEDAKIEEVLRFVRKNLHLELINIRTGAANTEYLFLKRT